MAKQGVFIYQLYILIPVDEKTLLVDVFYQHVYYVFQNDQLNIILKKNKFGFKTHTNVYSHCNCCQ